MGTIFSDYGIEIIKKENRYFIKYDAGELVTQIEEIEVSEDEANNAKKSEQDAYNVIVAYQNRTMRYKR